MYTVMNNDSSAIVRILHEVCTHMCFMCVCMCMYVCVCKHTVCVCMCIYVCVCKHTHTCMMYLWIYVCMYDTHVYIYIYIYIYKVVNNDSSAIVRISHEVCRHMCFVCI
jgi:hypothetical protein